MRLFIAVTDNEWFSLHASSHRVDEVNFWRPSPEATFRALQPGELLLFKLHAPLNFVVGGGFFVRFHQLPVNMAWDTFREANGVRSLLEMRQRIAFYRRTPILENENPNIGCIMLAEPFFWPKDAWIPCPEDFKLNTVQGKGYDSETGMGRELWTAVRERLQKEAPAQLQSGTAALAAVESNGYPDSLAFQDNCPHGNDNDRGSLQRPANPAGVILPDQTVTYCSMSSAAPPPSGAASSIPSLFLMMQHAWLAASTTKCCRLNRILNGKTTSSALSTPTFWSTIQMIRCQIL